MEGHGRVGAVSYLNARPLYEGLERWAPGVELTLDVPSRLADRLREGELDLALVPSVEYLRGLELGWEALPGLAIGARGAVRSVRLFTRVPWEKVERLALDEGSRTSQALAQIWLRHRGARVRELTTHPLGVPLQESLADAVLLIGDRAMKAPSTDFLETMDLGTAWREWTGLPFVFAVWAARPGADLGGLPKALESCRAWNLARPDSLYEPFGRRLGLTPEEHRDYLTNVLSYDLGTAELRGLRRFAALAAEVGLAPKGARLVFHRHDQGAQSRL